MSEVIVCVFCEKRTAEYLVGTGGDKGLHGEWPSCGVCVTRRGGTLPD